MKQDSLLEVKISSKEANGENQTYHNINCDFLLSLLLRPDHHVTTSRLSSSKVHMDVGLANLLKRDILLVVRM